MTESPSKPALLTEEDIHSWVVERLRHLEAVADLDRKLQGVRLMFPDLAEKIIGSNERSNSRHTSLIQPTPPKKARFARKDLPLAQRTIGDVAIYLLEDEQGGRSPKWFRDKMLEIPGLAERVEKSPTTIGNALSRLAAKGQLMKVGSGYYLPETLARIERGEIKEDSATPKSESFNGLMHRAMQEFGRPFKAAEALEVAKRIPELSDKLSEQPSRVYSWLSREIYKHKLRRDGDYYSYPSQRDGALNGNATSAPNAREVAPSPNENQPAFRLNG
jgi:hypothetical protein